jgi:hypothetical protein
MHHVWSQGFGSWRWDEGDAIAVDAAGNVVVTGFVSDTANVGGP